MSMDPEKLFHKEDLTPLRRIVSWFSGEFQTAEDRRDYLVGNDLERAFVDRIDCAKKPSMFTIALFAAFKTFQVSEKNPDYHPATRFLRGIGELPVQNNLTDADHSFCEMIVARGEKNAEALKARNAVCRIESPADRPLGTGVYLGDGLVLTCRHVLSNLGNQKAWARFGYSGEDRKFGDYRLFEIDTSTVQFDKKKDFALARMIGKEGGPNLSNLVDAFCDFPAKIFDKVFGSGPQAYVRLVHHFRGGPAVVSDEGVVLERDSDFLYHTVRPVGKFSSGAPVFNRNWKLVGIHRGDGGPFSDAPEGSSEAVSSDVFAPIAMDMRRKRDRSGDDFLG